MRAVLLAAFALALGSCGAPRLAGEGVGLQALFSGGYRALDHDTFDGHEVYAFELVTNERESGWGYELGASYGAESAGGPREHKAEFNEYSLGLRRAWQSKGGELRPYLGFGGAYAAIEHRLHSPREEFEDVGAAAYVHGGVLWNLGTYAIDRATDVLVGLDLRAQAGDDVDYLQLALVLGFAH